MSAGFDNRISLQKLEVFCLVVELGGVGRAAEHLYVAQPVVTAHLRTLQQRLGLKLFYRDGRQLRLTEGGERAYQWAAETLARTRELRREVEGLDDGSRGSVLIAASMTIGSYVLPPVLSAFRRERPHAEITLNIHDPEHATLAAETGQCDFAVIVAEEPPLASSLSGEILGAEQVVLVAAPGGPPDASAIQIDGLETLPLVTAPRHHVRRAMVDRRLRDAGVEARNVTIELGHPEAMKRAVEDGLGASLLFQSSVARELADGTLREVTIEDARLSMPVFLIQRKRKRLTAIQAELLGAVRRSLMERLEPVESATPRS